MTKKKPVYEEVNEFVTYGSRYTVPLRPVSPFSVDDAVQMANKQHPIPDIPEYEETTASGEAITIKVDEKAVEQYPELKDAWDKYQAALKERDTAINMALADLYMLEGTAEDFQPDEAWVTRRRKLYADSVPEDVDDLKLYWMRREVLRRPSDIGEFTRCVAELSEMTPQRLKQVEEMFRDSVEKSNGSDADGATS